MAPEGHLRGPLDARSDQFGLCVALWEALTGARPFPATSYHQCSRAVIAGEITGGDDLAPWLRAVLRRGLAVDPASRWPSLAALVTALDAGPTTAAAPARRRPVVAVAGRSRSASARSGGGHHGRHDDLRPRSGRPRSRRRSTPHRRPAPRRRSSPPPRAGPPDQPDLHRRPDVGLRRRRPGRQRPVQAQPRRSARAAGVDPAGLDWAGRGRRPGEAAFVSLQDGVDVAAFVDVALAWSSGPRSAPTPRSRPRPG